MALDISGWSVTPASNTTVDGVNIAENCPFSSMNDMGRAIMSSVRSEFMNLPATVSAATITNIAGLSQFQQMSGNTTIDGFSTAVTGMLRDVRVLGTPLIKNSSAMALQGSVDRQLAAGDMLHARSLGAGNWVAEIASKANASTGAVRAVTGTTDTILAADRGKLVTYSNAAAIAVTVPQATGDFTTPFKFSYVNLGAGTVTFTPTTSTLDGASTLDAKTGNGGEIFSDGANYFSQRGRYALAREVLTANRTYYVRTDGSDSNTGLVNNAGGGWLTLQKAWDTIQDTLDLAGYIVTVQVGDGTYTGPLSAKGRCVGQENQDSIVFQGNSGTPTNVVINATSPSSGATIFSGGGAAFTIKDMRIRSTTSGDGLVANMGSTIYFSGLDFGACAGAQITASQQSFIFASGNYTISGGATRHWQVQFPGALIFASGRTVTISGTPAYSTAFATASEVCDISCSGMTFTGSATGTRFSVTLNAVINTGSGSATYLPGDVGGSSPTGGQYA